MTRPAQFDVFLCHNSVDKPAIRAIAFQLKQRGISCWLDEEQLTPGSSWLSTQEQDMSQVKAVAVFVGQNGIGSWQHEEISIFLKEFGEHHIPIIPVLLADAPEKLELPIFLRSFVWVDFRWNHPDPMEMLVRGITGAKVQSTYPNSSISQPESSMSQIDVVSSGTGTAVKEKRHKVFISYSHEDKHWLKILQTMLKPLIRNQTIDLWDDTQIPVGRNWLEAITSALESAKVAVLLVSPNFLASDFIAYEELPIFLNAERKRGLKIIVVHVSTSMYDHTEIKHYQAANDPERPLDILNTAEVNRVLRDICKEIIL